MSNESKGYIHSTESLGTVDGPGLRFVVFFSGCPMRCAYCHNPDTWEIKSGKQVSVGELVEQYESLKEFLKNGGVTVTGGEPLEQAEFAADFFAELKKRGVHTCLDTSGITWRDKTRRPAIDRLLNLTDLVMLDIKHISPDKHRELTGQDNSPILEFAEHLSDLGKPVWIRHVLVPGVTDDEPSLRALGRFIAKIRTLKAIDILPYHTMGRAKYHELGIPYRLDGIPPATKKQAATAREIVFSALKDELRDEIRDGRL